MPVLSLLFNDCLVKQLGLNPKMVLGFKSYMEFIRLTLLSTCPQARLPHVQKNHLRLINVATCTSLSSHRGGTTLVVGVFGNPNYYFLNPYKNIIPWLCQ
jgi:hypothetical protein